MIKKINIFLVLLLLLISLGAVSAADDGNLTDMVSSEAIHDTIEVSMDENIDYDDVLAVDDSSSKIAAASHTINKDNYNQYFNPKNGELVSSNIKSGDTIKLDGSFSGTSFKFNKTVNIVGKSNNKLSNVMITFLNGASGSSVCGLNIENTNAETYGIFLNTASNCVIKDCTIKNTGKSSYAICVANGANYNNITGNDLKTYGVTYGHGTRSTPTLILSGSHHNYIANNKVEADDANGIYLSSYDGGPLKGGNSNFNVIYNNTVQCNIAILPTSWSYNIQVMGNNNTIKANNVIRGYRGISTAGNGNIILDNTIYNITGADYNHIGVETGGEYGIVGAYNSIIRNNTIVGSKIIATGAGISAIDNSIIENNFVNVTQKGRGIVASGSNVIIKSNIVFTELGSGIYEKDEGSGLLVQNNTITSVSGVGILIEKLSSKRMPKNVTIIDNTISTNNKYAIDAAGVQADTSNIDPTSNYVGSGLINSPAGVIDTSKPTYIYKGSTHTITPANIRQYINDNGGLTSEIADGDILNFKGKFSNEIIYVTKSVKITGKSPIFYNSTFKVTSGNVLIENLTIINKEADRVNAWGIFVNQAPGVRIMNNKITVSDPKAAYAIYILESNDIDVFNNVLTSEGDYLTFTILSYAAEDCNIANNTIKTIGTGNVYSFGPEKCIDGNELVIDGKSYCLDGNEVVIDGVHYCLDGNELTIDGKSYCLDGEELVIDGTHYCLDGEEITIDGVKYCLDGNEITIDGVKYCIDGGEFSVGGVTYCLDGNELVIDGVHYCLDGNEFSIDGRSYCLDGGELVIDGKSYCLDGNELTIDGSSYCLDGNEQTINGVTYCLDGEELVIDGVHYCLDGNEVTIDGVKYCIDGNNYCMDGAHVVSEIYQTYGILLLYSSNNIVSGNDVNVTSKLDKVHATTGADNSTNSLVGIDLYFNSHNNAFLNNNIFIKSNDNYIYGMGVLGYNTGHKAPEGQGATNNVFEGNEITLDGPYFVTGLIVGAESEGTLLKENTINLKSSGVAYGITLELSQESTIENNDVTLNSEVIYGIEALSSNGNVIMENEFKTDGKQVCGILLSNGKNNDIENNHINANGNGKALTVRNLDSLTGGNSGIYLRSNSTDNQIINNNITSAKGYAILVDDEAINNLIEDNYLASEKGIGNKAVNSSKNNDVSGNYKYIVSGSFDRIEVPYLGTGIFKVSFDKSLDGAVVKFYDSDNNYFAQGTVKNGVVSSTYKFDGSYIPAQYIFSAVFIKENYKQSSSPLKFVITKGNVVINVPAVSIQQGSTGKIVAKVSDEFGNSIKGANVEFYRLNSAGRATLIGNAVSDAKGIATLPYKVALSVSDGSYKMLVKVKGVANYNDANATSTLKVTKKPLITGAKNYSVYYGTTVKYKVKAVDIYGKPVAGKYVTFKVTGKKAVKVKTTKNGYATYSVKLKAGKYTIKTTFNGYSISKKLTFKPTLIAKNIVKKKAKTTKFTVKLVNKNGKILKAKKITFKFKGKKYTAKTSKKGIATLSLKNLKVGKYTITSTYGGCTVKNTIQIKK